MCCSLDHLKLETGHAEVQRRREGTVSLASSLSNTLTLIPRSSKWRWLMKSISPRSRRSPGWCAAGLPAIGPKDVAVVD